MIAHIDSPKGLTVFLSGQQITIPPTCQSYDRVSEVLVDSSLTQAEMEEQIWEAYNMATNPIPTCLGTETNGFYEQDGEVFYTSKDGIYKNFRLEGCLETKISSMLSKGMTEFSSLEKFLKNLRANPSAAAAKELYDFLSYKELPITPDGTFLAYKAVQEDYWSKTGNTETTVLKGKVDENGKIFNGVGEVIEILRQDVDDNRDRGCAEGAHAGSLDYARGFGNTLVVVEVNPKDVVSVPKCSSFQKLRACGYKVVAKYEEEIVAPVATVSDRAVIVPVDHRGKLVGKVDRYLDRKASLGYDFCDLASLQNAMSPEYPPASVLLRILDALGYDYDIPSDTHVRHTEITL